MYYNDNYGTKIKFKIAEVLRYMIFYWNKEELSCLEKKIWLTKKFLFSLNYSKNYKSVLNKN